MPVEAIGRSSVACCFCTAGRDAFLTDPDVVRVFLRFLDRWSREVMCHVTIYSFLPDRLHVVFTGHEEMSRPWRAIEGFRQSADAWLLRSHPSWTLEPDNYVCPIPEGLESEEARRILKACVGAGQASDPLEYPYTGSLGCDLWAAVS